MIDLSLYLAFIAAVTVLMLIPGPNVALIVANSVAHGARYGLLTVAGTSSAMLLQLVLVAVGMTPLLGALGSWFELLRWVGVAYLVFLGISQWRAPAVDLTRTRPERKLPGRMVLRALLVSMTNPKTLLFYGAFFPQFVAADRALVPQVALLSVTFVALAILVDGSWALAAGKARHLLASRGRLRNRISGGMLMGAGAVLAAARHK
ncbi:LysE family translocator [Dongia sp.]|uniref:LysE family translocator n=1 Tax=Dongia sp. TaxID=1977262 RepID=UPI003752C5EF